VFPGRQYGRSQGRRDQNVQHGEDGKNGDAPTVNDGHSGGG